MTVKIYFTGATSDLGNEVKRLQMRIAKAVQLPGFSNIKPYRGLSRVLGNSLARFLGGSGGGSLLFYPVTIITPQKKVACSQVHCGY